MALYNKDFIDQRREEFMAYVAKIEYEVAGQEEWYEAAEQSRAIDGNVITYTLLLANVQQSSHRITGLRFLDKDQNVIAQRSLSIEVNSAQTVLLVINIDYEEV